MMRLWVRFPPRAFRKEVIFHRKGAKYAPRTENAEDRKKNYFNRLKTKDKNIIGRGFTQIKERYKRKEVRNNIISLPGQKAPRTRRRREKAEDRGKKQEGRLTNN